MSQITVLDGNGTPQTIAAVDDTGQALAADCLPVVLPAAQAAAIASEATLDARTGSLTETAPATDTASSGLNGRLQRIAQRITSLIALLPASLGPKAGSASLSVVEATPTLATILKLTTSATGTTFVAFPSQACERLDIVNAEPDAVDLQIRRGGSGETLCIPAGTTRMVEAIADASDIQVRRYDLSDTPIEVKAEALKQ